MFLQLIFIFLNFISLVSSEVLKKYGSINTNDNYVIFESKEFNEGDEIYFKVKAKEIDYNRPIPKKIEYYYLDTETDTESSPTDKHSVEISKTFGEKEQGYDYKVIYFTIKKQSSEYVGKNGNYIYIYLPLNGWAEVSNTEKDEGTIKAWVIAIIVIACVIVTVLIIIFCVRAARKRRQLLAIAQASANLQAQRELQAQVYNNPNYQAQVYNNPVSQAQMNPVPVYPEQGYPSSAGFTPVYK